MCISWSSSIEHLYDHDRSLSIDYYLLLKQSQPPSKCQSDLYCEHTLCKEHDAVDNDEKMIVLFKRRIQHWFNWFAYHKHM